MELPEQLVGIVAVLVGAGVKAVVYSILLWIMVKLQGLNYTVFGLLLSSFAATATTFIPVAGPYIAYPVLLLCLRKVTQAEIFPDCAFTAVIANSLMFVVNLFVLGALIGSLRPDLKEVKARGYEQPEPQEQSFTWANAEKSGFSLRGITLNTGRPAAMIACDSKFYTVGLDEVVAIYDGEKSIGVKAIEITSTGVVLELDEHERLKLDLR